MKARRRRKGERGEGQRRGKGRGREGEGGKGDKKFLDLGGDFFIMKLIKKVKELKGFGASAAHGPFWGSLWGEGRGRKGDLILLENHHFQRPNCTLW